MTAAAGASAPLLTVRDLRSYLATSQGVVRAVDGVSLTVHEAEILGIVGESGCGKTVTCRTIMGLMPAGTLHASGEVIYHPHGERSILSARPAELQALRGAPTGDDLPGPDDRAQPGAQHRRPADRGGHRARQPVPRGRPGPGPSSLLSRVGIPAPARRMRDYPFQFSGGMLQRALIAIALASSPRLLLADEPTTSLDVIIQDQILSLLLELQQDTGMSMILVSHDLAVITEVCDRIVVMYAGQVVEEGTVADIIAAPRHPYTQALLDALPQAGQRGSCAASAGSPPSLIDVPDGLPVRARGAGYVTDDCLTWDTELIETGEPGARGALLAAARHREGGRDGSKERLGIGVVGAGRWAGLAHLPGWARDERCRIVGVCDREPGRAPAAAASGSAPRSPPTTTASCSAGDDIDIIDVVTRDSEHFEINIAAVEAGKHVLSEKPVAHDHRDVRRVADLARSKGLKTKVGFTFRYSPAVRYLKDLLAGATSAPRSSTTPTSRTRSGSARSPPLRSRSAPTTARSGWPRSRATAPR